MFVDDCKYMNKKINNRIQIIANKLICARNGLIDLLSPKESHYVKKYNAILHRMLN